jgi:hypothetical protein
MSSASPRNVVLDISSSTGSVRSVRVVRTSMSKEMAIPEDQIWKEEYGDDEDEWHFKEREEFLSSASA